MNLILISVVALLAMSSYDAWLLLEARDRRRELLALRDELRWSAIENARIRDCDFFHEFDDRLRSCASSLHALSFITMLPVLVAKKPVAEEAEHKAFVAELREEPELSALYDKFGDVLMHHLRARHWFILWFVQLMRPAQRIQERLVAAAFSTRPERERINTGHSIPA